MQLSIEIRKDGAALDAGTAAFIADGLRATIQSCILLVEREVKERAPQGVGGTQGGLRGSIYSAMRGVPLGPVGIVATPFAYAEVVERGRRPGQKPPPSRSLELWVEKKLDVFGPDSVASLKGEAREKRVKAIAFAVARSIGRRGFPGAFYFKKGVQAATPSIESAFRRLGLDIKVRLDK